MKDILKYELHRFGDNAVISVSSLIYIILSGLVIWFVFRWIKKFARSAVKAGRLDTGREFAIIRIVKYIFVTIFLVITLVSLHVNWKVFAFLTPLLIGIGLGLQQVANDLVSGIILLIEPSIRVNDIVEIDKTVSKVKEIGLRTSTVEGRDGISMIIPNHMLVSEKVINWSSNDAINRFKINIGVAYGSDVELVKKLLIEAAWKHTKVITNPAPMVLFNDFGESSLDFELVFWSPHLFPIEQVQSDLRFTIDASFRENGITIPFPQRDVHMIKQPE
ncbi:mechanosensitive ion channel [Bacteroidia bacterium]|nr:mechanosensitive ion channel [Bacteroidia bacterium]MDB9883242.1 mechanosensitive ion channel [Bacteroidia bacterium]MDC1394968.1 mechanosensitive ion channel [Bacteroidia bacterium]